MPTLGEAVQARIRSLTGTTGQWVEDWHALFDAAAIPKGQFGERLIAYYNTHNTPTNYMSVALNYYLLNPSQITNP